MKNKRMEWGLAVLRIIVGIVFLVHGGQKLFVYGFGGVAAFLASLGIPAPMLSAVVVTSVEFLGGLALVLGLFTRWAAALLAATMVVAIVSVHLRAGFFMPQGYEFALSLLGATLALGLTGPGAAAVDAALARRRS